MKRSPLFTTAILSAALHAPFSPYGRELFDGLQDAQAEIPETVLRIQSYDDMLATAERSAKREARIDKAAVASYKQEAREKMERGEVPTLKDLYADMERLKGVAPDKVERAMREAEKRIERYAQDMGAEIDHEELKVFVSEMAGPDSNGDNGQGSVAEYFVSGKHNCFSFSRGEAIVLEGVINAMPPEERSRYTIGVNKIKRHDIGTLTIRSKDGLSSRTYFLEKDVRMTENVEEDVGSKTIPIEVLKKGIVAEKPIVFQARAGEVAKSPDLLFVSDQPVDEGIVIEGPLRGSEAVLEEAARRGILPEVVQRPDVNEPIEIFDLHYEPPPLQGPEAVQALKMTMNGARLQAGSLVNPSPDAVDALAARAKKESMNGPIEVELSDMSGWSQESLARLLQSNIETIRFYQRHDEIGISPAVFEALKQRADDTRRQLGIKRVIIDIPPDTKNLPMFPSDQLQTIVDGLEGLEDFDYRTCGVGLHEDFAKVLATAKIKRIHLNQLYLDEETAKTLSRGTAEILVWSDIYLDNVRLVPTIPTYPNIKPEAYFRPEN